MMTVFDRIPDYFVERYNAELCAWGANFSKVGPVKAIILREGQFADPSPDEEQGAVLLQVRLLARYERLKDRMTVEPYTGQDEMLIARHCEKMTRLKVHPRALLVEPERPWLPFMPKIGKSH
jgi:hypothetical protein